MQSNSPPLFSIGSDKGRRSTMEDTHDIRLNFMKLPLDLTEINDVLPKHLYALIKPSNFTQAADGLLTLSLQSHDLA